jgi:hypothetical protein
MKGYATPNAAAAVEEPTIDAFLPTTSASTSPINDPTGPPSDIKVVYPSEDTILCPDWIRNVGSLVSDPCFRNRMPVEKSASNRNPLFGYLGAL